MHPHRPTRAGAGPRPRPARRPLALAAATLVALACALVGTAAPAAAHDTLVSTSPKDGASVASTPGTVVLTFEEPALAIGTKVVVTGPDGPVTDGAPTLVGSTVRQVLEPGSPAGRYQVQWRVTSDDGHAVSGTFAFTSKAASPSATASATPGLSTATATPGSTATAAASAGTAPASEDIGNSDRGVPWWLVVVVVLIGGFVLVRTRARRQGRRRGPS